MIETQRKADSAHMADSMKAAMDAAEAKRKADSAHMADSIAASKKGGTSKPKPKTVPKGEPKVGGHR
jgi:hypothetical protein